MSLLAAGCGFAAGIANPFTIGVAQGLAGLPMFSGVWLRVLSFVLIYAVLLVFIRRHAKKVERPAGESGGSIAYVRDARMDRGLLAFAAILGTGIAVVLSSGFIPALQDYTMIIVALTFLAAGISSVLIAGMGSGRLAKSFAAGLVSIAPSVLMILIPIIAPLSQLFGIPMQLAILAFAFGDGFSNVIYPTNAGLLITLGLTDVSYGEWFRYSWRFQLLNLILTCGILLFGLMAGYA